MEKYIRNWNDLTDGQQEMAISNYAAVRSAEEETECSVERARENAPFCRGYFLKNDGSVEVDI